MTSRFRYADRRFFLGWARLYADRIQLTTLTWRGLNRRTILLRDMTSVSWRADSERAANVTFHLRHDVVQLWISGAGLWKYRIDEHLGKRLGVTEELPGITPAVSAA